MALPNGLRLDGELVIPHNGGFDFAALQTRIHPAAKRCAQLAVELPAAFVAFDVLTVDGQDIQGKVFDERRARLVELVDGASPLIGVMPQTDDPQAVRAWMTGQPAVEGCVAKRRDQAYQPGKRSWLKLRWKSTTEGIIGGVFGELARPGALILGRPDTKRRLRVIGRTGSLPPAARVEIGRASCRERVSCCV